MKASFIVLASMMIGSMAMAEQCDLLSPAQAGQAKALIESQIALAKQSNQNPAIAEVLMTCSFCSSDDEGVINVTRVEVKESGSVGKQIISLINENEEEEEVDLAYTFLRQAGTNTYLRLAPIVNCNHDGGTLGNVIIR